MVPLLAIEGTGARMRYCVDHALTPSLTEARSLRLPRALWPLHYVTRLARLVSKLQRYLIARMVPKRWASRERSRA
jgi:hypothetical protein